MEKGNLYVVLAAVLYSAQPILVKLAYGEVPGFLMFSLRFFGMLFVFLPLAFHFKRQVWREIKQWKKFVFPALFVLGAVCFFTVGIYYTKNATLTALLIKTNSVFIPLMTATLFVEERRVLFSKRFLAGMFLAGVGVFGVITGNGPLSVTFSIGVALILVSQLSWSLYSVSIKRLIRRKNRLVVLCFIFPLAFLFSVPFAAYDIAVNASSINPLFLFIPIVSGIVVGAANLFQFKAIESKGLIVTNAFSLTAPLMTGIMGFIVFSELLSLTQVLFGIILVSGAALIIRCKCDIRAID